MANTKLLKVMEYLLNEQEDKARELLHQIFIEKARAIHEEMLSDEHDMMGGDEGEELTKQISDMEEEIDAEETANMEDVEHEDDADMDMEDAEEDLEDELEDADDVEMDADDADMDTDEVEVDMDMEEPAHDEGEEEAKIHDLEQAIAELKAEFEALKHAEEGEHHDHDDEEKMAEAWESETNDLDEEMHDDELHENVDLETVHAAKSGEVGSGKFAPAETNKHSPVPTTQTDQMGARPVKTGQGPKASGYDLQKAPESKHMGLSNRRKDAEDGKHAVSKEGDSAALLNKGTSAGYGAVNTRSPISGSK